MREEYFLASWKDNYIIPIITTTAKKKMFFGLIFDKITTSFESFRKYISPALEVELQRSIYGI